nr:oligosaccharide flippase family protein [uncultured Flavobacterium sp.]
MNTDNTSYRQIFKALSLFGGIQFVTTIVMLIKSKFIALYLGPVGFGISTLFTSAIGFVVATTSLGMEYSAVRNIASLNSLDDKKERDQTIQVFKKCVLFTGAIGTLLVIIFSNQISEWTFGSRQYKWSFVALSIIIIITAYTNGQKSILQGLSQIRLMAKLGLWVPILGLLSIPLYYFLRQDGIVAAMILSAAISLILSYIFSKSIKIKKSTIDKKKTINIAFGMIKFGILVTLSNYIFILGTYLLNVYINTLNGPGDVGLYQAGWMITNQAFGLIFTAMSMDYFPKISAISSNNNKIKDVVNQQAEITLLIVGMIIVILIILVPTVINILLSNSFIQISNFVRLSALGIIFKAVQWCMGYAVLAKGNTKIYLICELLGTSFLFVFFIVGYSLFGITGIGYGFIMGYFFMFWIYYFALYKSINFTFSKALIGILIVMSSLCFMAYIANQNFDKFPLIVINTSLSIFTIVYTFIEMNKRILLWKMISNHLKK